MIGIYKITNPIGEVYIGQSTNIYQRFLSHKRALFQLKLKDSYSLHGFDNHSFKVIYLCDKESLSLYEAFFIDRYDSINDGLNTHMPNVDISCVDKETIEITDNHITRNNEHGGDREGSGRPKLGKKKYLITSLPQHIEEIRRYIKELHKPANSIIT